MKMRTKTLFTALCIVAAACSRDKSSEARAANPPRTPEPTSYVGMHFDPMPAGVMDESGAVIIGKDGKPTPYVLTHVETPQGLAMWLVEVLPGDGVIRRRVVRAEMPDPKIAPGEHFVSGTCDVNGKLDGAVFAVVRNEPGRQYTVIHRAWRAYPETARFDSISTKGIVCEEPDGVDLPSPPKRGTR
jgi:hypothetical protein